MTTDQAHSLHHVNFPTADLKTTEEWYGKVFGMTRVQPARTPPNGTMLLTRGNFDLHFRPVDKADVQTGLIHFAIEVEDWDTFVTHLDTIEVPYVEEPYRGHDLSKTGSVADPDGHRVEFTWHPDRDW